ncbi:MAG: helix-turn-helix domain-containing protein [Candidatus Geothermincolia bacterium]
MDIGDQLRKVREYRGLSQAELARKSGVGQSTISQWESGEHKPHSPQLKNVLDVLNITHEQLYQDFDEVFVKEAKAKFETNSTDIRIVLTNDPALGPSTVEDIMHIVLAKEREMIEKEKGNKPE